MDNYLQDYHYDQAAAQEFPAWALSAPDWRGLPEAEGGPGSAAQNVAPDCCPGEEGDTSTRLPFTRLNRAEEKHFSGTIWSLFGQVCRLVRELATEDRDMLRLQHEVRGWGASAVVPQKRRVRRLRQAVEQGKGLPAWWRRDILACLEQVDRLAAEIVLGNLALVEIIALKFLGRGLAKADLVQEGAIGLMKAAYRFDAKRARFATYAPFWIRQAMGKAVVDQTRTIRLPSHLAEQRGRFLKFYYLMHNEFGRPPEEQEVCRRAGVSRRLVRRLKGLPPTISLDAPVSDTSKNCLGDFIADQHLSMDESIGREKIRRGLAEILAELKPKEARVLEMRYGLDRRDCLTLAEIGRRIGVSRERVRQIEKKALARLRHPVRRDKISSFL